MMRIMFMSFFGPDLVEKEEEKKGQFSPTLEPLLLMVDISHMRKDPCDGALNGQLACA